MSRWVKIGDEVIVIAGNDKGRTGKVVARGKSWLVVEGCNTCKKAVKKSQQHPQGGYVSFERPINNSNVSFVVDGKPVKLRCRQNDKKEKEIYYKVGTEEKIHRLAKK